MKILCISLGVVGMVCNFLTAAIRFSNGQDADGVAWALLGIFVLSAMVDVSKKW